MPDLVALRARTLALVARKQEASRLVARLRAVAFTLTPAMVRALTPDPDLDLDRDDEREHEALYGLSLDVPYPLLAKPGLYAVAGVGIHSDDDASSRIGNALYHMRKLEESLAWVPDVTSGDEPSLDGLTGFELRAVVGAYASAVSRMTKDLRDAFDHVSYLTRMRLALPSHLRSRCIGMFGGPDFETRFSYVARDFDRHATTYERVPAPIPNEPSRTVSVPTDHHPLVLSARYLAPVLGDEAALAVEADVAGVVAATAPRPGEPPTVGGFGSDRDNSVEVAYAPGEVDVDVAPVPRPAA